MSDEKFTWQVAASPTGKLEYGARIVKFGDGFEQRQREGIGSPLAEWQVTITDRLSTIQDVKEFLDRHRGTKRFLWTNPFGKDVKVVADGLTARHLEADFWQLSLMFREVRR